MRLNQRQFDITVRHLSQYRTVTNDEPVVLRNIWHHTLLQACNQALNAAKDQRQWKPYEVVLEVTEREDCPNCDGTGKIKVEVRP